jgi:hypothetical protein
MSTKDSNFCMIDINSKDSFNGMCQNNDVKQLNLKYSNDISSTKDNVMCAGNNPNEPSKPRWLLGDEGENYLRRS